MITTMDRRIGLCVECVESARDFGLTRSDYRRAKPADGTCDACGTDVSRNEADYCI